MPSYLVQVSYSAEALAAMIKKPHNRAEAVRKPIENLGGKIIGFWFSFGEYDVAAIAEMPDNVSAAAFAFAASAGGSCKTFKTTPLLTPEEAVEAMKKASRIGYKAATAKK